MAFGIPTIDITPYHPVAADTHTVADRYATALALHNACRDVGFFYLRIDGFFSPEEMANVLDTGRDFFNAPVEVKEQVHVSKSDGSRGWQRLNEEITLGVADHHEGYDLYAPLPSTKGTNQGSTKASGVDCTTAKHETLLSGHNPFPASMPQIEAMVEAWVAKMKVLGMAVMTAMADGLGMDRKESEALKNTMAESFWCMRLIGYPPLAPDAEGISCGAHQDYGCLTFLHADQSPGSLQILPHALLPENATAQSVARTPDSHWISADPPTGCIVVNIGQMWSIWSGGLYPATWHRVIHTLPRKRISAPFFFDPSFNAVVKVLDAAKRKSNEEGREVSINGEIKYGDFLLDRIRSNLGIPTAA